jgi:PelA/Pel-15E family pectate lyase
LLLRLYLDKRDATVKAALDKAIQFVLDSQYPVGGWPQRFPLKNEFTHHGKPDYTSFVTFNDDVTSGNIELLILCYQALGDRRLLDPIRRGIPWITIRGTRLATTVHSGWSMSPA